MDNEVPEGWEESGGSISVKPEEKYIVEPPTETSDGRKIIAISASSADDVQGCEKKYELHSIRRLGTPGGDFDSLAKGSVIHKILCYHYKLVKDGKRISKDNEEPRYEKIPYNEIILETSNYIRWLFAEGKFPDIETMELILRSYQEYAVYWANDNWEILEVEAPFTKVIFEDDEVIILIEGIVDLVVKNIAGEIYPVDHKSGRTPVFLNNQNLCYCAGLNSHHIVINKFGTQKTKGPADKFHRDPYSYPQTLIDEWVQDTIYWCKSILRMKEADYFPRRRSYCRTQYGDCHFLRYCGSEPTARDWIAKQHYIVREASSIYDKVRNEE